MEKVSWNTVNKKQNLNKSKMKNIKAYLEFEPNVPGVATPQSSEWIIYIIAYAYNPFTAPLGGKSTMKLVAPLKLQKNGSMPMWL